MYDMDLLRSLVAVVDCGGFTRASERLNATQSTISGHIRRLEAEVGHRLLRRSTRGLPYPTEEGAVLLDYARRILALQERARQRLSGKRLTGRLRIGMSDDFASGRGLTRVLAGFAALHPEMRLEIEIGNSLDLLAAVTAARLDLALTKTRGADGGGEVLWRGEVVWAGRAEMAGVEPLPLVLFPAPCAYRDRAMAALGAIGRESRVVYTSPSLAGLRAALAAGLGVAPLAHDLIGDETARIGAEHGLPALGLVDIVLHRRAGFTGPDADELLRILREHWRL
ncbi:LysR family transcriptional regulator [Bosea sp. CS1GBMeth4]|uniref:LysR family transcriptional regulator n=1 Tax=Bosea sp. CS1GBMeth4 TaxID=1892849 RepID=UPI001646BFD3|nr:LysR family transcriptional regulator [Bosea sp. CS1GBMeth4]